MKLPLICRGLLASASLLFATAASAETTTDFKRIPTQYIAALGAPSASSGTGAERWGLWRKDPGPRGVWFQRFDKLKKTGGVAPAKWTFDKNDWWLDENGLIMEKPDFSLPPGKYLVTGDRETLSVLTVHPMDAQGSMAWELGFDAKLYDVTHLPCRSARYRPAADGAVCTPESAIKKDFPVHPGHTMPTISGCTKQDYSVLFVVGVAAKAQTSASNQAACADPGADYQDYPGVRVLERSNGGLVLCPKPAQTRANVGTPYMVRRAELRSFDDPSQHPRCKSRKSIEASCGTDALCVLPVNDNLCNEPDVAKYTTHLQIEWKCRTHTGWRFNRVERGQEFVMDCRH